MFHCIAKVFYIKTQEDGNRWEDFFGAALTEFIVGCIPELEK